MKKLFGNKIVLIIIAVLIIGGGAGAYFVFFSGEKEEKPVVLYPVETGEAFTTNIKDSDFLFKVGVVLMVDDEKMVVELGNNQFIIRDTILFILRNMTEEQISAENSQEWLRTKIVDSVNKVFGIENVKTAFFSDFVTSY